MSLSQIPGPPPGWEHAGPQALADPASLFVAARDEAPVFYYEPMKTWIISGPEEIDRAMVDFTEFSNTGTGHVAVPEAFRDRLDPELMGRFFISMDPPNHTQARKVGQRGFTRPRMMALEPLIAASANELIDGFADDGRCDLMPTYCLALTTRTLMGLMGLGPSDAALINQLRDDHIRVLTSNIVPLDEPERTTVWTRYVEGMEYLRTVVEERIAEPGDDVLSMMATALGPDGKPVLSSERITMHMCEFAFAGTDTTAALIANAVVFLSRDDDQRHDVLSDTDGSLWENLVEETLRRRGSVTYVPRHTVVDVEIGGTTIPTGSNVFVAIAAASNDPRRFDEPERFDVHRPNAKDHVAFGRGRHFCLGAPLARTQGRVALQVLYDRLPAIRVVDDAPSDFADLGAITIRRSLPVEW